MGQIPKKIPKRLGRKTTTINLITHIIQNKHDSYHDINQLKCIQIKFQ